MRRGARGEGFGAGGESPEVSVVMPVRDAAATLSDAIGSVRAQTFADWELLIVDDASSDATRKIAEDYAASDGRIVVIRSDENRGAAAARNRAISVARGRYIAFLDADDFWLPEKLARQLAFMRRAGTSLTFTAYARRDGAGRERVRQVPERIDYETLLRGNVIGCLTAIYDRDMLGRKYMPEIRRRHDFALWLEIVKESGPAAGLNETLAIHRVRPGSLSANRISATIDTWRMYRDRIGLSRWQAGRNLAAHLFQRVFR